MITNDASIVEFKHRVITEVCRLAWEGRLDEETVRAFADGIRLADGSECMPAELQIRAQAQLPLLHL